MANNDWRDALVLCGIPQNRVGQFNAALGIDDLDDYMELPLADLKGDFETVGKNPAFYAQVVLIRSIKKCIALHAWGEYMLLRDQQFEAADFDQQTRDRFLQYVAWLGKINKEMEQHREAVATPTLKTSSEWLKFERQANSQLQTYRSSVLKHSLCYVIRPHDIVAPWGSESGALLVECQPSTLRIDASARFCHGLYGNVNCCRMWYFQHIVLNLPSCCSLDPSDTRVWGIATCLMWSNKASCASPFVSIGQK
jgi:hypothetical protein